MHLARRAVRDDVHGIEPAAPFERLRHLARRRAAAVEQDRFDFGTQIAQDRLQIGRGRVDKENFGEAGHGEILWALQLTQTTKAGMAGAADKAFWKGPAVICRTVPRRRPAWPGQSRSDCWRVGNFRRRRRCRWRAGPWRSAP